MGFALIIAKFIKRQLKASQLVLGASLILIITAIMLVHDYINIANILPQKQHRFDITKIEIAATSNLCPSLTTNRAADYEKCILDLHSTSPIAMTEISIPTLDEIIKNGRPDFSKMVLEKNPRLYQNIIKNGADFIVRINLPAELYSENQHDAYYNELVLNYLRNALVCVDGQCKFPINLSNWGVNTIPLRRFTENETLPIYIFGKHVSWNYILSLQDGLFVSNSRHLWVAKRFYSLYLNAEIAIFLLAISGVLFFLIWSAFVWKDHQDYSYLLYFGASFMLIAILDRHIAAKALEENAIFNYYLRNLGWLNAYIAMQSFALSTLRISIHHQLHIILGSFIAGIIALAAHHLYLQQIQHLELLHFNTQLAFSILTVVVPLLICLRGALTCWNLHREYTYNKSREIEAIALIKRTRQQLTFAALLLIFNHKSLTNIISMISDGRPESIFTPVAAMAYIGTFITLLRPSMLRLKRTYDLHDRSSEASSMRLLLNGKQYRAWQAKERSGIFIEADIKGSTSAMPELNQSMHTIMKVLKQIIQKDLIKAKKTILLTKPLGDAWIFIHPVHNTEDIPKALEEIVSLLRDNSQRYFTILQKTAQLLLQNREKFPSDLCQIGIHLRIFASEKFSLQDRLEKNTEIIAAQIEEEFDLQLDLQKTIDSDLDFIGEQSHILLRHLPKAPEGYLSVAASHETMLQFLQLMPLSSKNLHEIPSTLATARAATKAKNKNGNLSYIFIANQGERDHEKNHKIA